MQNLRSDINAKAAGALRSYILSLAIPDSRFAKIAGVPWSSLRYFLGNDNVAANVRRHKRGPYVKSWKPILKLSLPRDVREALLDAIYFEERIATPLLMGKLKNTGQVQGKE
jgi:hypothetical protein